MSQGIVRVLMEPDGRTPMQIDEGEAMELIAEFWDYNNSQIDKTSLITLRLTLYDAKTSTAINSRLNQTILDANGGTVDADGQLTLKLTASDSIIVDGTLRADRMEKHRARLVWQWNDGAATRQGVAEYQFDVRKLPVVS